MAQVPPVKTIRVEDFPDEVRPWIPKLLSPLNQFLTVVINAMGGALSFAENIQGQENVLDFTYNSSADFPMTVRNTLSVRPKALSVVSATEDSLPVILLASWQLDQSNNIQISSLVKVTTAGASAPRVGARYQVRIRTTP